MSQITLPTKDYSGYIFDLDGTIVNSMPVHFHAWRKALSENGAPDHVFEWDEFYSCGGMSALDVIEFLNTKYALSIPGESTAERKRECYMEMIDGGVLQTIPEVEGFIRSLINQGKPMAIATGSAMPGALKTLKQSGLDGMFSIIITPEQVRHGKPAPDMFLLAAEKMGMDPTKCIVFEDGMPGIEAAKAANMDYCFIPAVKSPL